MIPARRAVGLAGAWLALGLAAAFAKVLVPVWTGAGALFAVALALDAARALREPAPRATRAVAASLSRGVWSEVRLTLASAAARTLALRVHDHHPGAASAEGMPACVRLAPGAGVEVGYRLRADARGVHAFGPVELRVLSPWGLFERTHRAGAPQEVRVYPNFRAIRGYELLAAESRTAALGIRRRQRRGDGLDFHQLREYRAGDPLRQIDWKATARLRRAISREYQDERDQQIVFLLDCSQRLHAKDGERSHFDAALDAVLLAAHVALRQGDAVGLMTFSGERRWLAPRKGLSQIDSLLNAVYDLETAPRAADYVAAARDLAMRIRKRALVVLVSNLRDEDEGELAQGLGLLARRHYVLLASLSDPALAGALDAPIRGRDDALRVLAVRQYQDQRRRALQRLGERGRHWLDSPPDQLPVALANAYLDLKARGAL